jgi:hypothetical protein
MTVRVLRVRYVLAAICTLSLVSLAGCGGGLKRVPVSGTVMLDGRPLDGGLLYFNPDASKGNTARVSCASRVRGGQYDIQTAGIVSADSGPGAPPGWYKVTLRANVPGQPPVFPGQPEIRVDPKYLDVAKTPLSVEVVESPAPGAYDLKMTK